MASEKGGWTATGRRAEEAEGSGGGVGTAGTTDGDLVNGAASAAAVGGRIDASTVKKAGGLARPVDSTVAGSDSDAAADDDLVIGEAGGGLARAVGDLATVEPTDTLAMAELADDWETAVLCGSSWEREKEAYVLVNGTRVSANVDGDLGTAAVKAAAGDLASVFVVNSGFALSGSSLTWPSLCQTWS